MFADSILQTFGLPPHTPSKEETEIIKTIGTGKMDFNKGAEVFLKGVQKSDLELKKDPEIAKQRLISKQAEKKQPEKKQSGKEKNRLRLSSRQPTQRENSATPRNTRISSEPSISLTCSPRRSSRSGTRRALI